MQQNHSEKATEVFSAKEWLALTRGLELSPRLREIACRLLTGQSDKQIAQALGIGLPTVRTHMARLFSKLGVSDRGEVAIFFFRLHRSMVADSPTLITS